MVNRFVSETRSPELDSRVGHSLFASFICDRSCAVDVQFCLNLLLARFNAVYMLKPLILCETHCITPECVTSYKGYLRGILGC